MRSSPSVSFAEKIRPSARRRSIRGGGGRNRSLAGAHAAPLLVLALASASFGAFEMHGTDARSASLASLGPTTVAGPALIAGVDPVTRRAEAGEKDPGARDENRHGADGVWLLSASALELFGLPQLRGFRVAAERCGRLPVSVAAERFGSDVYSEGSVSVGAGRRFGDGSVAAVGVRACGLSGRGAPERWACAIDASLSVLLLERLRLSACSTNVADARIGGSPMRSGTTVACSLTSGLALITGALLVERDVDPSGSLGCEVAVSRWMRVRSGVSRAPSVFAAGVGVTLPPLALVGSCVVDVACQWHPELGVSSFVSITFVAGTRGVLAPRRRIDGRGL